LAISQYAIIDSSCRAKKVEELFKL